tara:strand:- start:62547 stop:62738 length:192 start_codon:yes stop_codon:yes gene_type:complete
MLRKHRITHLTLYQASIADFGRQRCQSECPWAKSTRDTVAIGLPFLFKLGGQCRERGMAPDHF